MSVTLILVLITAVVSYTGLNNAELQRKLIFNPYFIHHRNEWYRLLSHGFIHGDLMHGFFNLFVLYVFGQAVESAFMSVFQEKATVCFLLLYLGGIVASSLITYVKQKDNPGYNALGASGGTAAVMFAYVLLFPNSELELYFFIPIRGWIFGVLYLWYSHYMSKKNLDNIGHEAHLWGAVYGFLITIAFEPQFFLEFMNKIKLF